MIGKLLLAQRRLATDLAVSMMQDNPHFLTLAKTARAINAFILQTTDVQ